MSNFQHFTSLPPDQEASFIVFEQRAAEAQKSGMTLGFIVGGAIGLILLIIAFTVTPDKDPHAEPAPGSQTQKAE